LLKANVRDTLTRSKGKVSIPTVVYLAVPLMIAAAAFGLAQLVPGAGMTFVILASLLWTAWSARRARRRAG
jgi:hypothetical protein